MSKKINKADLEVIINEKIKEDIKYFNTLLNRLDLFRRSAIALHTYRKENPGMSEEVYTEIHGSLLQIIISNFYCDVDPSIIIDKDGNLNLSIENNEINIKSQVLDPSKNYQLTPKDASHLCLLINNHMNNMCNYGRFMCELFKNVTSDKK